MGVTPGTPGDLPEGGVVVRVDFGGCTVATGGGATLDVTVRGRVMGARKALGNAVVVGDVVGLAHERDRTLIDDVAPRRNAFSRRAAGERALEQVVAANLDQVVVVAALVNPEFRAGFVDRVLAQSEHAGIPARLVVNKADLGAAGEADAIVADYGRAGYPGHVVCAKSGAGVEHLHQVCRGRRSLFVGHSGVGKSTLLNALFPALALRMGEVNRKTGKGRHTTTAAELHVPEPGVELIDTPGVRSFGLWGIGPDDLDQAYPEFRPYLGECRFADCRHGAEPGCALREAAVSGAIAARRLESYFKLREELLDEGSGRARPREPWAREPWG